MSAAAALARAHAAGLTLEVAGDRLRWRGPPPPNGLLDDLRQHKSEVVALLTALANDRPDPAVSLAPAASLPPLPTDTAGLLAYVRDVLHCRVSPEGDEVKIRPTHRCPPEVVEPLWAVAGEIATLLREEGDWQMRRSFEGRAPTTNRPGLQREAVARAAANAMEGKLP